MKIKRRIYFPLLITLLVALALGAIPLSQPSTVYASPDAERQSPDVLIAQTNLSGAVAAIQDDPDSPDTNWLTAIIEQNDTVCHVSFATPTGNPTEGAGLQEFKIFVRKDPGTGTPTVRIDLYESDALVSTIMAASDVTSESGQLFSATWDASLLGTADGSGVECYIYGVGVSGAKAVKTTVEVGAVEWNVNYTPFSTAIEIRAQDYSTAVTAITFPEGAPGATVSTPYNNADGSGSPQAFGTPGTPVVTLFNGGSVTYTIWYNIATFTNGIVSSEYYLINDKGAACTSADSITDAVTFDADTNTGTTIAAGAGNEKDLYLKITLSEVAGKSGTSTLTILGEP